ncbi:MAG: STAS domain-containing protein [Bacteroidales bacterium]
MLKVAKEEEKYLVSLFQVNKLNTLFSELISQQLNNLVSQPGRHVIFNLQGIRFIDTAGFNVLERVTELSRARGCTFQICNITGEVSELIELMGLQGSLNIIPVLDVKEKIVMELDE